MYTGCNVTPTDCPNAVEMREFVMPGLAVMAGKYCARASRIMARAAWTLAAAAAIFWFEMLSFSSSWFNCGSLKPFPPFSARHLGRQAAPVSNCLRRYWTRLAPYMPGTAGVEGLTYFGPMLHPANVSNAASHERELSQPCLDISFTDIHIHQQTRIQVHALWAVSIRKMIGSTLTSTRSSLWSESSILGETNGCIRTNSSGILTLDPRTDI